MAAQTVGLLVLKQKAFLLNIPEQLLFCKFSKLISFCVWEHGAVSIRSRLRNSPLTPYECFNKIGRALYVGAVTLLLLYQCVA